MGRWKIRPPSIYPVAYTDVVLEALKTSEPVRLSVHSSVYSAHQSADRFREWRMCLRHQGHGRAFEIERDYHIRIDKREFDNLYELWISVSSKPLKDLVTLNPDLSDLLKNLGE